MRAILLSLAVAGMTGAGGAWAAESPRVIKTSKPHSYKTATCPSGDGKCRVVTGRDTVTFSLASKPGKGTRNLHAVIYAGICDAKNVDERIVRIEETRYRKSVVLLVVLEKLPPPDPSVPPVMCPAIAKAFPFTIRLSAALGKRVVRDGSMVPSRRVTTVPS